MPRVLAIHSGKRLKSGPCEFYRVTMPFSHLRKHWEAADWITFTEFHASYERRANIDEEVGDAYLDAFVQSYDLFVLARITIRDTIDAYESARYLIQKIRKAGKKVIYEIDDDYTNLHRMVASGDAITLASWCDAITVTTPHLANTMHRMTGRPIHVVPNMLDPAFWDEPSEVKLSEGKVRIVLSGSTTHSKDWEVLQKPFEELAEEFEHLRILIGGYHPKYLENVKNIEFVPALEYPKYAHLIKNADIILAPLIPNDEFNMHKSPIKAVEGMGATRLVDGKKAGAAVIATDCEVYRLAITNGDNGFLVEHTPEAWKNAMRELIVNTEKRKAFQFAGYKTVDKRFSLETGWSEWARAYLKILQNPSNPKEMTYEHHKFAPVARPFSMPDEYKGQIRSSPYPLLSEPLPLYLPATP